MFSLMLMKILKPCTVATQNSAVRFVNTSHWIISFKTLYFFLYGLVQAWAETIKTLTWHKMYILYNLWSNSQLQEPIVPSVMESWCHFISPFISRTGSDFLDILGINAQLKFINPWRLPKSRIWTWFQVVGKLDLHSSVYSIRRGNVALE